MMVVNAQLRAGAQCKAGDTVEVVLELDEEPRTVTVPAYLKKLIHADEKTKSHVSAVHGLAAPLHDGGAGHAGGPAVVTPTAPSPNCSPPYYIDSAGHRQYKPECL